MPHVGPAGSESNAGGDNAPLRYIQNPKPPYELIPAPEAPPSEGLRVYGDIEPYKSQLTGEYITSRSKHRVHLRDHGCIEVGNDPMRQPKRVTKSSPREQLTRAVHRVLE